jgi:hypothetical protein
LKIDEDEKSQSLKKNQLKIDKNEDEEELKSNTKEESIEN